jgi:hypothetical protein
VLSASGGAIDDWSLGVSAFTAVGTVGATALALYLALRSRWDSAVRVWESRKTQARQVIQFVVVGRMGPDWVSVEVLNAGPGVISNINVMPRVLNGPPEALWVDQEFGDDETPLHSSGPSTIHYLLSGESATVQGRFRVRNDYGDKWAASDAVPLESAWQVEVLFWWQDDQGVLWGRKSFGDPYPTRRGNPESNQEHQYRPVSWRQKTKQRWQLRLYKAKWKVERGLVKVKLRKPPNYS